MEGISGGDTQQLVGLAVQKSALDIQANMVSTLMQGPQGGQADGGLRTDALGERGIGTRLSTVA
jgi:hypothetical protein